MAAESSGSVAGLLRGSCAICQSAFTSSGKIAALACGHTFHFLCVSQWLAVKKECPNCRKKVTRTGMIEKLFFDVSSFDGNETKCEIDYAEKAESLATELQKEKEAHAEKQRKLTDLQNSVKSLEKKIVREKEKYDRRIPALEARNRHLEMTASDTDALKIQLDQVKAQLRASSFYDYLIKTEGEDKAENELAKYLKGSGAIETEKFFELMKKQNKGLSVKLKKSESELSAANEKLRPLKKDLQNKDDVIRALRKEIEKLRQMANVDTPINKKLRSILMGGNTPADQKRVSMGFDRTNLMEETLNETFLSPTAKEQCEKRNIPSTSSAAPFSFDADEDDEDDFPLIKKKRSNERPRLSSDNSQKTEKTVRDIVADSDEDDPPIFKKLGSQRKRLLSGSETPTGNPESKTDDSLDFSFDISVPSTILRRTVAAPAPVKTNILKNRNVKPFCERNIPQTQSEGVLPIAKNPSTSYQNFGNALKRTLSQDDKPTISKKPASRNARISSFFGRKSPVRNEDIVTLD